MQDYRDWLQRGAIRIAVSGFLLIVLFASCGGCKLEWLDLDDPRTYSFLSYNVFNLFDGKDDGSEYPEFNVAKGTWSQTEYESKLENLSRVIKDASSGGADFLALYEVENPSVLKDLIDRHLQRMGYQTFTVVKDTGAPIGLGFISRLPILDSRTHKPPSMGFPQRPILELKVDCGGIPLIVFLGHFKSKKEGAEATEGNRIASAEVIVKRMLEILKEDPSQEILVLGDLNVNIDEYRRVQGRYPTAILPLEDAASSLCSLVVTSDPVRGIQEPHIPILVSPWLLGQETGGSYWYKGEWHTLDHVLLCLNLYHPPGLTYKGFKVVRLPYLLKSTGEPNESYSDHLPLWVEFSHD